VMAKRHNYSFNSNSDKGFISPHNITTSNNLNKQTNTEVLRIKEVISNSEFSQLVP